MGFDKVELGLLQLSAMREVANIGLGHAVKALTEVTGRNFNMSVPYADSVPLTSVPQIIGGGEALYAGVYMPVEGDVPGHMAFLFPWASAQTLWMSLLGTAPENPEDIDEMSASALLEVGNIITGSFLSAIAGMTNFRLDATPPALAIDMCSVILEAIVSEAILTDSVALAIETSIFDEHDDTQGIFVYIPTRGGLNSLLNALGVGEAA